MKCLLENCLCFFMLKGYLTAQYTYLTVSETMTRSLQIALTPSNILRPRPSFNGTTPARFLLKLLPACNDRLRPGLYGSSIAAGPGTRVKQAEELQSAATFRVSVCAAIRYCGGLPSLLALAQVVAARIVA
jgi:hypothetical protein